MDSLPLASLGLLIKPARISLPPGIRPGTNSHWLLGGDAEEAGDASLASASSTWVGGRFQASFHWFLEDAAGDAPSFSSWAVFFWASWMAEIQGGRFSSSSFSVFLP